MTSGGKQHRQRPELGRATARGDAEGERPPAAEGALVNWREVLRGYQATVDWPGCAFYQELMETFPEAKVILTADRETTLFLMDYFAELRYIFIVSQVEVHEGGELKVEIRKADGQKCERCWNYSVQVGEFKKYPTVCERCADALSEIEQAAAA